MLDAIAQDWQKKTLGKVCDIQIGGTPSRNQLQYWATDGDGHIWVAISDLGPKWVTETKEHITDFGVAHSNVKLVKKGTPLMSFKLTIGNMGIAGIDLYTNEAIAAFTPRSEEVWSPWLYHILPSIAQRVVAEQAIKGQTLNKNKMQHLVIHLPNNKEQQRIASILDTIDEQIQETERLLAKLKLVKAGLLHDLLTRGIDEHGDVRDPVAHPEQFKDSALGRIPREWEVSNVGNLGMLRGGSTPTKAIEDNWLDGNILWISPKDIRGDEISNSEDKITQKALDRHKLTVFNPSDIILVFRSGILRHTFPVATVSKPFTVNQDIKVLSPNKGVYSKFAFFVFQWLGEKVLRLAVKAGTTVESVDLKTFISLPVLLPKEGEQNQIAAILNSHDARIVSEEEELTKLRQVKRGLMHDLLTGRVRVGGVGTVGV